MKKISFYILVTVFFILSFFMIEKKEAKKINDERVNNEMHPMHAVYLSYIELNKYIKDKDTVTSQNNIKKILDNMNEFGFNTIILHVRPFSDAIYESNIYPISDTVTNNGKKPEYDVLKYIIDEAHKRGIDVHAWINPYRVSTSTDFSKLDKSNPAYKLAGTNSVKVIDNKGIFYNPASAKVNDLIVSGVEELVTNYNVDGIHFDDYFYPDSDIDLDDYNEYISKGGTLSLEDYRYNNVSTLIKRVYAKIKDVKKDVVFGISPEGNLENNYKKHFLNVEEILSSSGYVDYIMPQLYFGFKNQVKPFKETLDTWNSLIKANNIKLIPALAFYKIGREDVYAKSGSNEWVEDDNIISRQIEYSRTKSKYDGFSLFRYDYIFNTSENEKINNEVKSLRKLLNLDTK